MPGASVAIVVVIIVHCSPRAVEENASQTPNPGGKIFHLVPVTTTSSVYDAAKQQVGSCIGLGWEGGAVGYGAGTAERGAGVKFEKTEHNLGFVSQFIFWGESGWGRYGGRRTRG